MRITGGQARGRALASFKGLNIRPTPDQVREALFNILGQNLGGKSVLDLFAGTGAMGLEALSRGARRVVFVDSAFKAISIIKKNIETCGLRERTLVLRKDLRKGLPSLDLMGGIPFDLVFIDPPYRSGILPIVMAKLVEKEILAPNAIVVAETHRKEQFDKRLGNLNLIDVRAYGDTKIHFYCAEI